MKNWDSSNTDVASDIKSDKWKPAPARFIRYGGETDGKRNSPAIRAHRGTRAHNACTIIKHTHYTNDNTTYLHFTNCSRE
jgi:hypothetical protein